MLETNPVKRMEMLRKELISQGKSWNKLNEFEQNVIVSTFGVSKEQAALGLSSDSARRKLQKQADEQARANKINMDWDKGLGNVKQTLVALQPKLDKMLINVANIVSKLFGFKSGNKGIQDTAKTMNEFLDNINIYLETKFFKSPGGKFLAKMFGISIPGDGPEKYSNAWDAIKDGHLENYLLQMKEEQDDAAVKGYNFGSGTTLKPVAQVVGFNQPQNSNLSMPASNMSTSAQKTTNAGKASAEQTINIAPAPIYLDGKQIASAIFKQTRR